MKMLNSYFLVTLTKNIKAQTYIKFSVKYIYKEGFSIHIY